MAQAPCPIPCLSILKPAASRFPFAVRCDDARLRAEPRHWSNCLSKDLCVCYNSHGALDCTGSGPWRTGGTISADQAADPKVEAAGQAGPEAGWGKVSLTMDDHGESELISLAAIDAGDLKESVAQLLVWLDGQKAHRQKQIVTYLVDEDLAGRAHLVKAYTLALDVFDKADDFDPSRSSLVRVEMHRLRDSLNRYARENTGSAPYVLVLPPGQYKLMARLNDRSEPETVAAAAPSPSTDSLPTRPGGKGLPVAPKRWLAAALVLIFGSVLVLQWGNGIDLFHRDQIDQLSPTVTVEFDAADQNRARLTEVREIVGGMNPIRFPVVINMEPEADYVLHLATTLGAKGLTRISASLFDRERDLIASETYPLSDFADTQARYLIGKRVNERFLRIHGYVANDFPKNTAFDPKRREIYGCYRAVNLWNIGTSKTVPDFDRMLKCMDPGVLSEPRDKVLVHVTRAGLIANSISGIIKTRQTFEMDDARAELVAAEAAYPDNNVILAQMIVMEWRDPKKDNNRLRAMLERAERGVMSVELRYNVANSYAYFLGDWDAARRVANEDLGDQQGMRPTMGGLYHYVELPEPFVKGDYDAAEAALHATGATTNPTYAVFKLAIACARGDTGRIQAAQALIAKSTVLTMQTTRNYVEERQYAPQLEQALLAALGKGPCDRLTAPARIGAKPQNG